MKILTFLMKIPTLIKILLFIILYIFYGLEKVPTYKSFNVLSFFSFLGIILSLYSLSLIANVKKALAINKQDSALNNFLKNLEILIDFLSDNPGDFDGDFDEKISNISCNKLTSEVLKNFREVKSFDFKLSYEINSKFFENINKFNKNSEEKEKFYNVLNTLENLSTEVNKIIKKRNGENIND